MKNALLILLSCFVLSTGIFAQGYMGVTITQSTDSLTADGSVHINIAGISQAVHTALYRLDTAAMPQYIDSGIDVRGLGWGTYMVLGAVGSHAIQLGGPAIPQNYYGINDLFAEFQLGAVSSTNNIPPNPWAILPDSILPPTANNCDGSVDVPNSLGLVLPFALVISDTGSTAFSVVPDHPSPGLMRVGGLCGGKYILGFPTYTAFTFFTGTEQDAFRDFSTSVTPSPASTPTTCDGSAHLSVIGGIPPFLYTIDSASQIYPDFAGLCEGVHTYFVADTFGHYSGYHSFVIGDLGNYYSSSNTSTGPALDTIFVNMQNCAFDFGAIVDSASLYNIYLTADTNTYVIYAEIWQQGQMIAIYDTVHIDSQGVNQMYLSMYCDTFSRAVHGVVTIIGYVNTATAQVLGVRDITAGIMDMRLSPNPATDAATVTVKSPANSYSLTLADMTGRSIQHVENIHASQTPLDIKGLPSGIYTVTMHSSQGVATRQLVKY